MTEMNGLTLNDAYIISLLFGLRGVLLVGDLPQVVGLENQLGQDCSTDMTIVDDIRHHIAKEKEDI